MLERHARQESSRDRSSAAFRNRSRNPGIVHRSVFQLSPSRTTSAPPPAMMSGELRIATWPEPIAATWSTIPRFALVDLETGAATDPGPCVELGRARRIEQVSFQTVMGLTPDACTQPCDNDPR